MTGCYTCGGGMGKHDPVAHDQVPESEPCMCGTDFTCMADVHDFAVVNIQQRVNETIEDMAAGVFRVKWTLSPADYTSNTPTKETP